nr:unnamed protein product [Callosobruchus analis]
MFVKKFEHTNCRNMSTASFRILVKNYLLKQCFYSVDEFKLTLKRSYCFDDFDKFVCKHL